MKIAILDDHPATSAGLKLFFETKGNFQVNIFTKAGDLFSDISLTEYDLFFVDIDLPDMDGIQVCNKLRKRHITAKIVILTSFDKPGYQKDAVSNGADAFLSKNLDLETIFIKVKKILEGDYSYTKDFKIAQKLPEIIKLTKHQHQVAKLLFKGHIPKEVAISLNLSKKTVDYHIQNLKIIFQVSSLDALRDKIYKKYF